MSDRYTPGARITREPLQPCQHIETAPEPRGAGFPPPGDAPRGYSDLHVLEYTDEALPAVGATVRTVSHDVTGDKATDWLVVGHGINLEHCTGRAPATQRDATAGTVYHEPATYRRAYLAAVWLLRIREIRRRLRERGLIGTDEDRALVRTEMGAEGWVPQVTGASEQ